jgi:hypothetical protein
MNERPVSYLNGKLRAMPKGDQDGVFAIEKVFQGELLTVWGGEVIDAETFANLPEHLQELSVQVEEDLYLVSFRVCPSDKFNHCCDPNAGLVGQITLVALRDIEPGEEVRFDYAMSDGSPYDEFDCNCNMPNCRKRITGNDWQIPELIERYRGHFSPYLQRRIDQLHLSQPAVKIFEALEKNS